MKVDLIIHNSKQLVTCASNRLPKRLLEMQDVGLFEDGAIAVKDGKIAGIGKSAEILCKFQSDNLIDAGNKTVTPAFVECHTHAVFAGNRLNEFELKIKGADYLEILANGGGILSTVRQTREAGLNELIEQSRFRLDKMLSLGIGTCEIKTGYGLDADTELKMLKTIFELDETHPIDLIPTFLAAHTIPPEFKENSDDYVDLICEKMLPATRVLFEKNKDPSEDFRKSLEDWTAYWMAHRSKARQDKKSLTFEIFGIPKDFWYTKFLDKPFFVDVFCEKNAFSLKQSKLILETAKLFGFRLKAHVDEFTNLGCARLAIKLGATSIDHLDKISDEEINLLADSDTIGVVTPTVNFNFGSSEFADARKLIDAGCAIAVSTDYNPGSAPCPSLPTAMAIACRYQKILPSEALNAITINAAFAIGLGQLTGSLEIGKQADILILDTKDYREIAYEFGSNFVETVFKKGDVVHTR